MGDFNAFRHEGERKGCIFDKGKADDFNDFVNRANLQDITLGVSMYTWVGQGGGKMLDRFLLSRELLATWPGLSAMVLDRVFSDHCPIMLKHIVFYSVSVLHSLDAGGRVQ